MGKKEIVKKITALIPSPDMRRAAAELNYVFGEKDLLKIVYDYCDDYAHKLALFSDAAEVFEDKIAADHASKLAAFFKREIEDFGAADENCVYEIYIKFTPDDGDGETYITRTFVDAISLIKKASAHYKDVGFCDNALSEYRIAKKAVGAPKTPRDLDKLGSVGWCVLGHGYRVKSVEMYNTSRNEFGKMSRVCTKRGSGSILDCNECSHICMTSYEPELPVFLEKYDLAAYISYEDRDLKLIGFDKLGAEEYKRLRYCIVVSDPKEYSGIVTVIPLDNKHIRNRTGETKSRGGYYEVYLDHDHVCPAELIKPDPDKLPDGVYADHLYAAELFRKIDEDRK